MNALQTFFGAEAYKALGDEAVLASHPMHCVQRPPVWLGGGEISDWLNEHIGLENHCWLSAHDRGSHLFFMTPAQANRFCEYLKGLKTVKVEDDGDSAYCVKLGGRSLTRYTYDRYTPANSPSRQIARRLADAWREGYRFRDSMRSIG